ncbi:MAG: hypothetical protein IPK83_12740 [Planctomycetes bacterium]|nr:hypothetical protein [Planctomycetota bacterium]
MPADYIPRADGAFDEWQLNFLTYLAANAFTLGIGAADIIVLQLAQTDWTKGYEGIRRLAAELRAIAAEKARARAAYTALIRSATRRIQARTKTTDEERRSLGIRVRDVTPTASPAPAVRPHVQVSMAERLRHRVLVLNESTGAGRAAAVAVRQAAAGAGGCHRAACGGPSRGGRSARNCSWHCPNPMPPPRQTRQPFATFRWSRRRRPW